MRILPGHRQRFAIPSTQDSSHMGGHASLGVAIFTYVNTTDAGCFIGLRTLTRNSS